VLKRRHQEMVHARFTQHMVLALERRDDIGRKVERLFTKWWLDLFPLFVDSGKDYVWYQLAIQKRYAKLWKAVDALLYKEFKKTNRWSYEDTFDAMMDVLPWQYWEYLRYREQMEAVDFSQSTNPKAARELYKPMPRAKADQLIFAPPPSAKDGLNWKQRITKLSGQTQNHKAVADNIASGIAAGKNPRQIAKQIAPFVNRDKAAAERIARTEALRVSHMAKREQMEQFRDVMSGWRLVATFDERTRTHHAARHGDFYAYPNARGELPEGAKGHADNRPMVPDEPNCRCDDQPVVADIPGVFDGGTEPAVVASVDGPIEDPVVFGNWFDRQEPVRQRRIVGTRRFSLVKRKLDDLGAGQDPTWPNFYMPDDGTLVPMRRLAAESVGEMMTRTELNIRGIVERTVVLQREKSLAPIIAESLEKLTPIEKEIAAARQQEYRRLFGLRKKYGEVDGKNRYVVNRVKDLDKRLLADNLTDAERLVWNDLKSTLLATDKVEAEFRRRLRANFQAFADSGGKAKGAAPTIGVPKPLKPVPTPPKPTPIKLTPVKPKPIPISKPTPDLDLPAPVGSGPLQKIKRSDFVGTMMVENQKELDDVIRGLKGHVSLEDLDPNKVVASTWNEFGAHEKKLKGFLSGGDMANAPPVLVHRMADGSLEVIDGIHRVTAARKLGLPIRAIVIDDVGHVKTLGRFRDTVQYDLAHWYAAKHPDRIKRVSLWEPGAKAISKPKLPKLPTKPPTPVVAPSKPPVLKPAFDDNYWNAANEAYRDMMKLGIDLDEMTNASWHKASDANRMMQQYRDALRKAQGFDSVEAALTASDAKRRIVRNMDKKIDNWIVAFGKGGGSNPGSLRKKLKKDFREMLTCVDDTMLRAPSGEAMDSRSRLHHITMSKIPGKEGAANPDLNYIKIGDRWGRQGTTNTLTHEFGHHLFYRNGRAAERMDRWLDSRMAESSTVSSHSKGYIQAFNIKEDKFADPYIGRIYNGNLAKAVNEGVEYYYAPGEGLSMPMEALMNRKLMLKFLRKDHEHLRLAWAMLRGF